MHFIYIKTLQNEKPLAPFKSSLHSINHARTEHNQWHLWVLRTCLLPGNPPVLGAGARTEEVKEQEAEADF